MLVALLPEMLVERIGWLLVHSIWQFTVLALVLAAVLQAMRRRPANARYCACVLAWAAIVLVPAVTWILLPASIPDTATIAPQVPVTVDPAPPDVAMPMAAAAPEEPAVVFPAGRSRTTAEDPVALDLAAAPTIAWWMPLQASIARWLKQLVLLWCFGVLLFGLRPVWGWYAVHRLKRRGISAVPPTVADMLERTSRRLAVRQKVRILQSALVSGPVVVGALRPLILLPLCVVSGLSPTQLEAVLAHELAHVRRHDYVVNLLQTLSETIFFYHPALWWVSSRIRHEREHCCDDLAAEALGNRADYGRALLAVEELRGTAPVLSLGARGGSLLERVRRLAGVEPSPGLGSAGVASIALVSVLLATALALSQIRAATDPERVSGENDVIIEGWTVQKGRAVVKGRIDASRDLVVRIDRDERPREWRHRGRGGAFEVVVEASDTIRLEGGKSGHGFVVTTTFGGAKGITNVALTGPTVVGTFSVRRKADVVTKDVAITFADVELEDGQKLPVSLGLEKSPKKAGSAANLRRAASEAAEPSRQAVNALCVDAEGKPVAGAEVHLFQSNGHKSRYVHSGPLTSDEQGRVVSDEALFSDESGHFDRWIYARVPGRLVGVARSAKWNNRRVINPELRVELQPSRSLEGRVTVPEGFDPTDVTVRVRTLHVFTGPAEFDYESFPREHTFPGLDTALPEIFECRPDAEGRIRFNDVPARGRLYLVTVGRGLGEAQWRNDDEKFDQPIRLKMDREGLLTGRVLSPDGAPAVGTEVVARLSGGGPHRPSYLSTFQAVTDQNGDFALPGLPAFDFVLSLTGPQDRWVFRPHENLFLEPGETRSLELQMETGIVVSGRVRDPDGRPVEGAAFSALADTPTGPGLAHDSTDADGRYEFRLPPGAAKLYFNSLPEGFAYPDPQIVKHLDLKAGQAAIENLNFTLERKPPSAKAEAQNGAAGAAADGGQRFELLVRGPDGKSVADVSVEIRTKPLPAAEQVRHGKVVRAGSYGTFIETDADGRLVLDLPERPARFDVGIRQPGFGPYWAGWSSERHSEPVPSRFVAHLDAGWSVGGVVVDAEGAPIEGVNVRPSIKYKKRPGDTGELGVGTRLMTDADGRWRFDSVPESMNEVFVEIDHPDFMPNRRPLTRGEFGLRPGEPPAARIELRRGLSVAGRVTDEAGSPIAGATLRAKFLNDLREARTDENGEYRLGGCEPRMTRLVAFAPGRATDMREIRVGPETEPVDFQLPPGGTVRVRVLDHEGRPLPRSRIFFQRWRGRFQYFEFNHASQYTDENGVWEWNEAPLDEFQADICPPGGEGVQLLVQPLVARDEEYVFRLPRPLVITGRVIDAATRRPVESFRVVPGIRSSETHMNWARGESHLARGGRYRLQLDRGYLAHLVRIEAEGYQVAVSREIKSDEGQVRVDFELKQAADVAATVLTPDGRPAAGARVALGIAGSQISVKNGAIDDGSTYAARRDTDEEGRFRFPAPDGPCQLVITHSSGFFHFKSHEKRTVERPAGLPPLPVVLKEELPEQLSLTPWAQVEGVFRVGPRPVPNASITLNVNSVHSYGPDVPSIFTHHDVTTGPEGRFVFERAFPGEGRIGRRIMLHVREGATEVTSSQMVPVQLKAGEKTRLDLGGDGHPVRGRLEPPAEHTDKVLWNFALVRLEADGPLPRRASPSFTASVDRDGAFRIDDVPPGEYVLSVRFSDHRAGFLPDHRFTIPKAADDQAAQAVDLGTLTLERAD